MFEWSNFVFDCTPTYLNINIGMNNFSWIKEIPRQLCQENDDTAQFIKKNEMPFFQNKDFKKCILIRGKTYISRNLSEKKERVLNLISFKLDVLFYKESVLNLICLKLNQI